MPVSHIFSCTVPDNPLEAAAGKVVPSNWNSVHSVMIDLASEVSGTLAPINGGMATGFTGTNATGTLNSNGLALSINVGGGAAFSGGVSTIGNTLGNTGTVSNQIVFAGGNNVTLSQSTNAGGATVTISGANIPTQSVQPVVFSGSNGSFQFSTLSGGNLNGLSFYTSNGSMVGSHNGLTSQSNQAFSAEGGSSAFQTLSFSNANGISFSNNAGQVQASYTVPSVPAQTNQTVGLYGLGNTTQNSSTTLDARSMSFNGLGGMTVGYSNGSIQLSAPQTVAQTNQSIGIYAVSNTTGASSSSTVDARSLSFQGAGVASVGMTNGSVVISVPSGGGAGDGGNVLAAGTQTANTTGTVLFNNGNGITFGMNNSSVITASHNGITQQSTQPVAISGSNGSFAFSTLTAGNLNGLSFYTSNGSLVGSYTVPTQSTQPVAVSGSNGSFAFSTATFGNLNGLSFYTSNGSMVGSYTVPTVTNSSMTVSDSATSGTLARLAFTNLNGVTLSLSTGAGGSHTIVGSHNALTSQSNQAFSASGGSSAFQTLNFANSNGLTFSNSNGSVIGSYTVPTQSAQTIGLYGVSNTTGQSSSSTVDARSFSMQGRGAASVGLSNGSWIISAPNAGAGNVTFSAGTTSNGLADVVFSNSNNVSFGLNGSTITASVDAGGAATTASGFHPFPTPTFTAVGQVGNATLQLCPVSFNNFQMDRVVFPINCTNSSNSSGSHTLSFWFGFYTKNASTLSLVQSTSTSLALTHSGTAGSYSLYSGMRLVTIPFTTTLTAGSYWIGQLSRTTSGGTNGSYSQFLGSGVASNFLGHFGSSQNTTMQIELGRGVYSASISSMPGSIGFSQIRGSASGEIRPPYVYFASGTA